MNDDGEEKAIDQRACVWVVEDHDETREFLREVIDAEGDIRCEEVFPSAEDVLAHLNSNFAPEVMLGRFPRSRDSGPAVA